LPELLKKRFTIFVLQWAAPLLIDKDKVEWKNYNPVQKDYEASI